MNPWSETALVAAMMLAGVGSGLWLSRLPRGWWLTGYLLPLTLLSLHSVSLRRPEWALHPLLAWQWTGRWFTAASAAAVAMLFFTLIPRLPIRRDRRALGVLLWVLVGYLGVWPSFSRAAVRDGLSKLVTSVPPDGICRQSTDYTCGPAAAVTGLRVLGIRAEEGALALLAGTSPATGTPPQTLVRVLNDQFGAVGLRAELRGFRSVEDLTEQEFPMLVLVRFSFLLDHWLVVTGREACGFAAGDPLSGPVHLTGEALEGRWRRVAIVLHRSTR